MKHGSSDQWPVTSGQHHAPRTHQVQSPGTCRLSGFTFHVSRFTCLSLILLASTAGTRAVTTEDNPYQAIIGRNVFSLKPPPPPSRPEDLIKKEPPPKIKLQGVNNILGRPQVLCKVLMPAKPPERPQPKEESFVMSEGERQGEIEVLEINMQMESVKFKNHDQVQLLNMKDDADKPVVSAPPPGSPPGALPRAMPGVPPPTAAFNAPASGTITTIGGAKGIPLRPIRSPTTAGGIPAGTVTVAPTGQAASQFSHEEQELLIEAKRKYYEQQGDPRAKILPPTTMTLPK
jgi:hypothetical protein